jgi:serine/threonine-protein phosphatase 2A activator
MLDDISAVKTWDKVNSGMIKMYLAEVLGKLPVVQHFLFGSMLPYDGPAPPSSNESQQDDPHRGHAHTINELGGPGQREVGWGDCCGIPVPSAFGAANAGQNNGFRAPGTGLTGPGIRPVPFD